MNSSLASLSPAPPASEKHSKRWTSIANMVLYAARHYPHSGVCLVSAARDDNAILLTYPALLEEARQILGGLRASGHSPGSTIALLLEHPRDFIPAFWACQLGGYVPCLLVPMRNDPERWATSLAHIDVLLEHPLFVTTDALRQTLTDTLAVADLDNLRTSTPSEFVYAARLEDAAILVLTSGSTGNSKAVVLTHGNILASMAGKTERQRMTHADITLNWISFDHIAALSEAHLLPLYVGAMQVHVDPMTILADPLMLLLLIDRYRVSMTFTPNFLLGQINAALQLIDHKCTPLCLDLACVRHIVCGGEAIVVETARRFLTLLEPYRLASSALWPAFGMTETCAGCVYSKEFPIGDRTREFASLGLPINGLQMRIVDDSGTPARSDEPGELQLRGPMVFGRYYNNDEATRAAFTADGWFRTGDLGCLDEGRLNLIGRSKDSIIVSGVNYFSHELETALQELDGIERSFMAAFPTRPKGADTEQLVITFATSFPMDDEAKLHQLTIAVRNTAILLWGFRPALILPLPRDAFTKTSLGKIQRAGLRKRLEAGEFSTYEAHIAGVTKRQLGGYTPPQNPMETAIAGIYAEIFSIDPAALSATASFFDLGGTSLDIVMLKRRLERYLDLADLPIVTILQNPTVRELARHTAPEQRDLKRAYDPIVPLQVTGTKTPLFCVHPGIGEILVFVNLAKYFVNDRPFYALRTRGFNEGEDYFGSFEEMVLTYTQGIRKRQPHGPYAIAGYSYGAPVAFEIAKLLESQGERVEFVGSIDMPPSHDHEVDAIECAVNLAFFLSLIDMKKWRELPDQLRATVPAPDPCEYLMQVTPLERLAELDINLAKLKAWTKLTHALLTIARPYVPSGTVDSITVFYAQPLHGTKQDWLNNELRRWDEFSRTPACYIDVPGEHYAIMGPKHVGSFQAVLRAELDRKLNGK